MSVVVIGIGNVERRDDGVGPAVAAEVARQCSGVRVVTCAVEPVAILDAWNGAELAVIVDAVAGPDVRAGRVRVCTMAEVADAGALSSHEMSLPDIYKLGLALDRAPQRVVIVAVDTSDIGYGGGLSSPVAAAVPAAVALVRAELARCQTSGCTASTART